MTDNFKLESHITAAINKMQSNAVSLMHEAVNEVRNETLNTLTGNRSGRTYKVPGTQRTYTASAPGEPPAQRTGELRQSVKGTVHTEGKKLIGKVGTDKDYGLSLEKGTKKMAPRPWLQPSFEKSEGKIKDIFNRPWEGM